MDYLLTQHIVFTSSVQVLNFKKRKEKKKHKTKENQERILNILKSQNSPSKVWHLLLECFQTYLQLHVSHLQDKLTHPLIEALNELITEDHLGHSAIH